jgi:hypothetical protein
LWENGGVEHSSSPMTPADLFPTLRSLPRADKLKVMQFLIAELAKEDEPTLQPGVTYSLWSPLNSHEAAHKLAQLLESELRLRHEVY